MQPDPVIYAIDDNEAVLQSLKFVLTSAGIKVRLFESAEAFLDVLPEVDGGCVVTDVRMPGMTGIDLLKRLNTSNADLPVIIVTGHGDVALAVEAMKIGAFDFLEKPFDDEMLIASVRAALRRDAETVERKAELGAIQEKLALLTARERQVLEGLVAGNANKVIAYDLGISPRTVEIYRANVMTKLEANSLSDLVRMALLTEIL